MDVRTLTWRALSAADVPALTRALARAEAVDATGEHFDEADIGAELADDAIDWHRDSLAARTPDGEIVAHAWVHSSREAADLDRIHVEGAVVPVARDHGLGRRLLRWADERAAALHRERHPGRPGAICVEVHERNAGKEALVRAAGYEATRWWYRMVRPLDVALPPVPPTPAGLTRAPYAAALDEAVRLAHCEAFADHWGSTPPDPQRWSARYTGAATFRPDVSSLVLGDKEVVAYLLTFFWEADAAASGVRDAFVGVLGVRPRWRRRGLGTLLLAAALHDYRAAGYERSALTVDSGNASGALGLYERAGYVVDATSVTWTKPI